MPVVTVAVCELTQDVNSMQIWLRMTTALLNHVYAAIGKSFRRVHTFDMMVVTGRVERGGTVLKKIIFNEEALCGLE